MGGEPAKHPAMYAHSPLYMAFRLKPSPRFVSTRSPTCVCKVWYEVMTSELGHENICNGHDLYEAMSVSRDYKEHAK